MDEVFFYNPEGIKLTLCNLPKRATIHVISDDISFTKINCNETEIITFPSYAVEKSKIHIKTKGYYNTIISLKNINCDLCYTVYLIKDKRYV